MRFLLKGVLMGTLLCTHMCGDHVKPPQTVLAKNGEPKPPKLLMGMSHGAVAIETSKKLLKTLNSEFLYDLAILL